MILTIDPNFHPGTSKYPGPNRSDDFIVTRNTKFQDSNPIQCCWWFRTPAIFKKPVVNNGRFQLKLPSSTGEFAGFLNHQQSTSIIFFRWLTVPKLRWPFCWVASCYAMPYTFTGGAIYLKTIPFKRADWDLKQISMDILNSEKSWFDEGFFFSV